MRLAHQQKKRGFALGANPATQLLYPRAYVVVGMVALVLLLLGMSSLCWQKTGMVDKAVQSISTDLAAQLNGNEPWATFSPAWLDSYEEVVPEVFYNEVVAPKSCAAVASDDGGVVGLMFDCSVEEALEQVSLSMEENGWVHIESESSAAITYVKDSGVYSWAALSCTQTGDTSSIVFTLEKRAGNNE